MRVLKDFVHSFDFVRMKPDRSVVVAPEGLAVQALVEEGRQYAVYLHAPVGDEELRRPADGADRHALRKSLTGLAFDEDVALAVRAR
jgi:hypothetical protein